MHYAGLQPKDSAMAKTNVALTCRLKPTQQRAKESVELILRTTATLLDEVGMEGFTTNLLAERANIRVRTVYRYFPNKYAVIIALTEALAVQWDRWMTDYYEKIADPRVDWRRSIRSTTVEWLRRARRVPGSLSVLQAMNATPELQKLHFRIFEDMSRAMAAALRARGVELPATRLAAIARTAINLLNSGFDVYLRLRGREAQAFLEELNTMKERYLERYLDGTGRRRKS
jgi:AcrR family transcriptional regulator